MWERWMSRSGQEGRYGRTPKDLQFLSNNLQVVLQTNPQMSRSGICSILM